MLPDHEALRARLQTLTAEVEAERAGRQAELAAAEAARAALEEARLQLGRTRGRRRSRWFWSATAAGCLGVLLAGGLAGWGLHRRGERRLAALERETDALQLAIQAGQGRAARATRARDACQARRVPATVVVSSVPSGAEVRLKGVRLGTTPLTLTVPPGTHQLELVAGGKTKPVTVSVDPGTRHSVTVALER